MSDIPNAYNLNSPPALTPPRDSSASELDRLRRELAEMKADARALARECEAARAKDSGPSGCVAFTGNTGLCEHCDLESDLNHARKATDDRNAMRWAKQQPTP